MLIIMAPTHLVPQDDRQAQECLQPAQALRTKAGLWVDSTHLSKMASGEPYGSECLMLKITCGVCVKHKMVIRIH